MFGSEILEVGIGLVFVYLLMSLTCSAASELLEGLLKYRAKDLERGLRELLQDPNGNGLVKAIYEHPLVYGLFAGQYDPEKKGNLPSYIPARTFAMALLDVIPVGRPAPIPAAGGTAAVPALEAAPEQVSKALKLLFDAAGQDLAKAHQNVEAWFNDSMERVSGWYKRRSHALIFAIGFGLALLINADSITIANGLANDKAVRDAVVGVAETYRGGTPPAVAAPDTFKQNLTTISGLGLPIGWEHRDVQTPGRIPANLPGWILKLVGCLLTACACTVGAPFWFDMLNKIITLRSTIKPREQTPAKATT